MVIWYGLTSVLLGVLLYYPARKVILGLAINRQQSKLKRELTAEELDQVKRRSYVLAAVVAMTFAFLYNRYIMRSFF